jgi:hypothetical protein
VPQDELVGAVIWHVPVPLQVCALVCIELEQL